MNGTWRFTDPTDTEDTPLELDSDDVSGFAVGREIGLVLLMPEGTEYRDSNGNIWERIA